MDFLAFWNPKRGEKKLAFRPRDPHGEIRAGILCRIPVLKSQMVGWRPIWWQKGVIWGPLGFRAQPAHPWGRWGTDLQSTLKRPGKSSIIGISLYNAVAVLNAMPGFIWTWG